MFKIKFVTFFNSQFLLERASNAYIGMKLKENIIIIQPIPFAHPGKSVEKDANDQIRTVCKLIRFN